MRATIFDQNTTIILRKEEKNESATDDFQWNTTIPRKEGTRATIFRVEHERWKGLSQIRRFYLGYEERNECERRFFRVQYRTTIILRKEEKNESAIDDFESITTI